MSVVLVHVTSQHNVMSFILDFLSTVGSIYPAVRVFGARTI